jgi:hypothetical protein
LSDEDAVALSSHLNWGTGQHGQAGRQAIEDDILVWVSRLLHSRFNAKMLVCFGLHGIISAKHYNTLWNRNGGLPVDWTRPLAVRKFNVPSMSLKSLRRRLAMARGLVPGEQAFRTCEARCLVVGVRSLSEAAVAKVVVREIYSDATDSEIADFIRGLQSSPSAMRRL